MAICVLLPSGIMKFKIDDQSSRIEVDSKFDNNKDTKVSSILFVDKYIVAITADIGYLSIHSLKTLKLLTRVLVVDSSPLGISKGADSRVLVSASNKIVASIAIDSLKTR